MTTPSERRTNIRKQVKDIISPSLSHMSNCKVFTARGESNDLEDFVCVYFDEGDRFKKHSLVDTEAELVIRLNTKADPRSADARLDQIASYVELALEASPSLNGSVFELFNASFNYADSPSGNYSSLELTYRVQYSDSE